MIPELLAITVRASSVRSGGVVLPAFSSICRVYRGPLGGMAGSCPTKRGVMG